MKKNVQIPFEIYLTLNYLLHHLDDSAVREKDKKALADIKAFFREKGNRLRAEAAYTDFVRSSKEKKEEALNDYIATKKMNM